MKLKILLALSLIFFAAAIPLFVSCSRSGQTIAPSSTPTPLVILKNGVVGAWYGSALTSLTSPGCTVTGAVTAVTDSLSGDTSAFCLSTTKACGTYGLVAATPANPLQFYSSGHFQFDIRLEQPPSNFTSIVVEYMSQSSPTYAQYSFPTTLINNLSTTSFTRVSLPFTSFTGYVQSSIDTPFYIGWFTTAASTGAVMTFDNVVWTTN